MKADAVAHLRNVRLRPGIVAYIECIDPTLEPYGAASSSMADPSMPSKARSMAT